MISILSLLCIFLLARPVAAQTSDGPQVTVTFPWDGYLRAPGWTELQITLLNEAQDWEGQLQITDKDNLVTYQHTLSLPAHSRKYYRIPVFLKDVTPLQIALLGDPDVRTRDGLQQTLIQHLKTFYENDRVCVLVAPVGQTRSILEDCAQQLWLQDVTTLPESALAWDVVDVLIFNDISTSGLTIAQQEALLSWVSMGGHLVLAGDALLPQTLAGLPDNLQIATLNPVQIVDHLNLKGIQLNNQAIVPLTPAPEAQYLLEASVDNITLTLAVQQRIGMGKVTLMGIDMERFVTMSGYTPFWSDDSIPALQYPLTHQAFSSSAIPVPYKLMQIPASSAPASWLWMLVFPLYILLMVPGTLIIVRRLQRPVLAWVLLPIWIVLALVILSLILNGTFSRTFPLVNEIAIITVPGEDLPARVVQGSAIYAPRFRTLTWKHPGIPRPLSGAFYFESWYGDGEPYPVTVTYPEQAETLTHIETQNPVGIITWGIEGIYTPPAVHAQLEIQIEDHIPTIVGQIESEVTLHEVVLMLGTEAQLLEITDVVTEGLTISVFKPLDTLAQTGNRIENFCSSLTQMNYYAVPTKFPETLSKTTTNVCFLTGVMDEVPFSGQENAPFINSVGTRIGKSCLVYTIPCPSVPSNTSTLQVPLQIALDEIENGWTDESGSTYISLPHTTLRFVPLDFLPVQDVYSFTLTLEPPSWMEESSVSTTPPTLTDLSLWDYESELWIAQTIPALTVPLMIKNLTQPRFFDPEQGIRVRLTPDVSAELKILITVEGTVQ
ncbi:MAG: hypothetical protein JXA33_08120 [Anaerolineae bacterium]|nr:hypothetical protein [Anaerolineae bacterium]